MTRLNDIFIHSILSSIIFKAISLLFQDRLLSSFLDKKSFKNYLKNKVDDDDLEDMAATNGVAWLHAVITGPICLFEAFRLWYTSDLFVGESIVMEYYVRVMMGFFLWDIFECVTHLNIHGFAFTIHAIGAYVGLLFQIIADDTRMFGLICFIGATEVSTIFLHYRWILIKGKNTQSLNFKITNFLFTVFFLGYRVIFLLYSVYPNVLYELYYMPNGYNLNEYRRYLLAGLVVTNCTLNLYWVIKTVTSYFKNRPTTPMEYTPKKTTTTKTQKTQ